MFFGRKINSDARPDELMQAATYGIATADDLPALAAMRFDFHVEDGGETAMTRDEFIDHCVTFLAAGQATGKWVYWVAKVDGEAVATAFIQKVITVPRPSRLERPWGYLTNVYTRPEYRNQSFGGELLRQTIEWCRAEDLETLVVWPSDPSREFYKRLGFASDNQIMEIVFHPD